MRRYPRILAFSLLAAALPAIAVAQTAEQPAQPAPVPDAAPAPQPAVTPPPPAPAPAPTPAPKKKAHVDGLKPGQYVWEARASQATDLRIVAVLDIQRIYVFDGPTLVAFSTMSTGKKGKPTPTGTFEILQKNVDHKSNLYSNAPMPYMQRLTWDGIALHAGHIPGYPASHGCLRLPMGFAKALYGVTKMAQPVTILADLSKPAPKPEPKPEPPVEPKPEPVPVDPVVETPPPTPTA